MMLLDQRDASKLFCHNDSLEMVAIPDKVGDGHTSTGQGLFNQRLNFFWIHWHKTVVTALDKPPLNARDIAIHHCFAAIGLGVFDGLFNDLLKALG